MQWLLALLVLALTVRLWFGALRKHAEWEHEKNAHRKYGGKLPRKKSYESHLP